MLIDIGQSAVCVNKESKSYGKFNYKVACVQNVLWIRDS
jgi:hypothetical protein